MSNKTTPKANEIHLSNKFVFADSFGQAPNLKDSLRYIVISPKAMSSLLQEDEHDRLPGITLRFDDKKYQDAEEDVYDGFEFYSDHMAYVHRQFHTDTYLVYVTHTGRLYLCADFIESGLLLKSLRDHEASKIIN